MSIPAEIYLSVWDMFYVLLAILIELVLFAIVLCFLFCMTERFINRFSGVHLSVVMFDRRDRRDR